MTAEHLFTLLRLHPPGQRVRFKNMPSVRETFAKHGVAAEAPGARMHRVEAGVVSEEPIEGMVILIVPDSTALEADGPELSLTSPRLAVLVEYQVDDGWDTSVFKPHELEPLPIEPERLEVDLRGRIVHFPRSSGIGIAFPPGASDFAVIAAVRFDKGWVSLTLAIDIEGRETPFLTEADFTQCELRDRRAPSR